MTKLRVEPWISANKLAEYADASPTRRRQIIKSAKRPADCILPRYTPAEISISQYLTTEHRRDEVVYRGLERLCSRNVTTKWYAERNQLCLEAVEAFLEIADEFQLSGVEFHQSERTQRRALELAGVVVGIRPDVFLTARNRKGDVVAGAIKLHFSKTHQLSEASGNYAATLVNHYLSECPWQGFPVNHQLCFAVDVFGRKIYKAPRAYSRQLSNLRACCEEIAMAWPSA